jgi:hypothetical protein
MDKRLGGPMASLDEVVKKELHYTFTVPCVCSLMFKQRDIFTHKHISCYSIMYQRT